MTTCDECGRMTHSIDITQSEDHHGTIDYLCPKCLAQRKERESVVNELRGISDDLAASVAQWKPGEYCIEIVNGASYAVRRIRSLADRLAAPT